jgi:hypothetical protein
VVHVALFFEALKQSHAFNYCYPLAMLKVLDKTIKRLEKYVAKQAAAGWDDAKNKYFHLSAFNRMLRNLKTLQKQEA